MGRETRLFQSEEQKSRADAAVFLRQLADKLADGKVVLSRSTEEIVLKLSDRVILEVQVEDEDKGAKGIEHSLEVAIKWFDSDQEGSLELK